MYKLSNAGTETDRYNLSSELELPVCDYIDVEHLKGLRPRKSDLSVLHLNPFTTDQFTYLSNAKLIKWLHSLKKSPKFQYV